MSLPGSELQTNAILFSETSVGRLQSGRCLITKEVQKTDAACLFNVI
jgi:hypothetical protein